MHDAATRAEPWNRRLPGLALFAGAVLLCLTLPAHAATLFVDETGCTLIDAILAANNDAPSGGCPAGSGADTIVLTTDVTLTTAYTHAGLPTLESPILLQGHGHTISRDGAAPAFRLMATLGAGVEMTLQDVTLSNGSTVDGDGLGGGALVNGANLTLNRVTVAGNRASRGGGIFNHQFLFVHDSTIVGNSSDTYGGGIVNAGVVEMTNSTLSANSAAEDGGGLYNRLATAELTHCTLSGNSAGNRGGAVHHSFEGSTTLRGSLVANSPSGGNCLGVTGSGNNFDDDGSCGAGVGALTGLDPNLADNGGPTRTHALLPGSSAIDAAGDCGFDRDQRGAPRNDDACDSGAYEFQCSIAVTPGDPGTLIAFSPAASTFDLVTGDLADLHGAGDYSDATCLGNDLVSPATDPAQDPDPGDGRYYLARGVASCVGAGYGDSSLLPDVRDALDTGPCP